MSAVTVTARSRVRSAPPAVLRTAGVGALLASVLGSWSIAAGAAASPRWLELPTSATPAWIEGPLRGTLDSLSLSGFGAALIVMLSGYLVALWCATSIGLRAALIAVVLANVAFTVGPTLLSTDAFGYIAYVREAALHGLNPYVSAPVSLHHDGVVALVYWKHQPSPYGPLFTIAGLPLGLVPVAVALWSYKAVAGAAALALAFLVAGIARERGTDPARAAILVGLNPVLLVYAVSGAHNDLLATALVACALALMLRGREGLGAGAAVSAAAIKVTLGLALPFVLIAARRRGAAIRGAAVAVAAIGIPSLVLFGGHVLNQVHRIAADPQFDIAFSGPDRLATGLGIHINGIVRAAAAAGAGLVAAAMIARALRGHDPIAAAGWAFLALIASIASFAPWYLVWLLPLAAVGRSRALWIAALLATLYVLAVHLPALGAQPWLSPASGPVASGPVTSLAP